MNPLDQMADPLRIVTTAVAPVVMVSATAILISGVNARYMAVSDRVRSLTQEYRHLETSASRRQNILSQMLVFRRRMHLVSWASRVLYAAVGCFIAVTLLICLSTIKQVLTAVTLPIFVIGVVFVGGAIVLQFMEIQASHQTIELEAADVFLDAAEKISARI